MTRYFFEISYCGKHFFGWQKQPNAMSVQEEIENQLTKQVRYLDKLIDELAKGKKMEKILRNE